MLDKIIDFSLNNRVLVLFLFGAVLLIGVWVMWQTPVDAFPDTTPVQVQINTNAPSLNAAEIEKQITFPVETAISGLPGLLEVRSISKFGLSQVVATFDDDTDIYNARQFILERLQTVDLPVEIERPSLGPISTGLGEIFHYIVTGGKPEHTGEYLRTLHHWLVKPELLKVAGVAEINSWGGFERQFQVVVSPQSLVKYRLTLEEIFSALENNNRNVGGGQIVTSGQTLLVHGLGRVNNLEEIRRIPVKSVNGVPVLIGDVAEVRIGHQIRHGAVTAFGEGEAVLGLGFMLMGENSLEVTQKLTRQLNRIRTFLPEGVNLTIVYARSELVAKVISTVEFNLLAGALLVVMALFFLLENFRAGVLVALAIPLALVFAFLGMYSMAIAASLLSLGAMDFGIFIDGSVVLTENNMKRLGERRAKKGGSLSKIERLQVVAASSKEVVRPIVFGMSIIVVVFLPILFLRGMEGKMFRPMAWTFIFALTGALLVAIFLSPVLSYYFMPDAPKPRKKQKASFMTRLEASYEKLLKKVMRRRKQLFIGVVLLMLAAAVIGLNLGGEFIPRLNEGAIVINTIRLAGVSIGESTAFNTRIEKMLMQQFPDEIKYTWSRIGTAEVATDPMGIELTDIFIALQPRSQWKKAHTQEQLVQQMEKVIKDLPGLNMIFTQPIEMRMNEMVSGIRSDVGIKIFGDDFDRLVELSDQVQLILKDIHGAEDISGEQITGQPTVEVRIDRGRIARLGMSANDVLQVIETIAGRKVGDVFEGQKRFPLVVKLDKKYVADVRALSNLLVTSRTGALLPLAALAQVKESEGPATINRQWGRRLIKVQCNVRGRDVASFVAEARERLEEKLTLPAGYVIEWGGQFEHLERSRLRFMITIPLTLALIFFLLYFSLKRLSDVIIIYTGIPFATIGGILALWLRGIPFSVSAAVGFIALSGIAVLNGQVLVTTIHRLNEGSLSRAESVISGACQRLRPVLATAITDAVGFIPMALSTGVGAEVQRPLASVIIGGIITSTLLTLFVLPAIYHRQFAAAPIVEP
jgi:cobalt-zinc-cadmium resistance protein CzcA